MAHSGKSIIFATDLLPNEDNIYYLGKVDSNNNSNNRQWKIYASEIHGPLTGNADTATTASKLTTSNLGTSTKPIYLVAGVATECSNYAGGTAVTLNNASKAASTASFYAPTSAGTAGYILKSAGSGAPGWYGGLVVSGSSSSDYAAIFGGKIKFMEGTTTTDTYGDAYTPIYWNAGKPATVSPVQKLTWTIASSGTGTTISKTAITANTYVVEIVVDNGKESYLNAPITWTTSSGSLALATAVATSSAVTGYVILSRGTDLST